MTKLLNYTNDRIELVKKEREKYLSLIKKAKKNHHETQTYISSYNLLTKELGVLLEYKHLIEGTLANER